MRVIVALALLLLTRAAAADDLESVFKEGRWYGAAVDDGDLSACIMTASFEGGGSLVVVLTATKQIAVAAERKEWSFGDGTSPPLRLQLDGRTVATLATRAYSELAFLIVADPGAFGGNMGDAATLRIVGAGEPVSFDVRQSGPALLALLRCAKGISAPAAAASPRRRPPSRADAFSLPKPGLLEQLMK